MFLNNQGIITVGCMGGGVGEDSSNEDLGSDSGTPQHHQPHVCKMCKKDCYCLGCNSN
jgi:hypothetical protein